MLTRTQAHGAHILTLDDGKVNALNKDKLDALVAALADCAADPRPVVLRGRKGIFSAGFDLKGFAAGPATALAQLQAGKDAILAILRHRAPVVAVCEGHAYPMGAFLLLASDHAIGTEGDFVCGMNESAIGLVLPEYAVILGSARLSTKGRKAVATAELFAPADAREVGYLDTLVAADALEATLESKLAALGKLNMGAFAGNKLLINRQLIAEMEASPLPILG